MSDMPLVVSFYTPEYEESSLRLIKSLERHVGKDHHVVELPSRGNWRRNCCMKGPFMRDLLLQKERPLLWLDADAEVKRPLKFFEDHPNLEFACYAKPNGNFLSGTVYMAPAPRVLEMADAWVTQCLENPRTFDQQLMKRAYTGMKNAPKWTKLPQGYCKIFDHRWAKGQEKVEYVVHHQASRGLKKIVNQGP